MFRPLTFGAAILIPLRLSCAARYATIGADKLTTEVLAMTQTISSPWERRLNAGVSWGLRHWLLVVNGLALAYAGLPWISPLATAAGHPLIGQLLFMVYAPLCHQLPERSFFVWGHQVAFCHRCAAMYSSIALAG